jgi:transcriptional regulator of acetoin/glycerol metabolism
VLDVDDLALTGGVAHEAGDAAASLGTMPTETSAAPPTATRAASAVAGAADADLNLDRSERVLIERALRLNGWNISLAARDLGLSRGALYRRMERHGL